jgi:hypothetical protein
LSGTTYEKFQKNTLVWLDDFGKNEKLILSKVKNVNVPPKIESINTIIQSSTQQDVSIQHS